MDSLTGPDASTLTKIGSIALPVLGGVAAAATPGGARGLAGATNVVNTMAALRDLSQRQQAERAFGQRLTGLLDTEVAPGRDVPAPPEAAMYSEQATQRTPGQRLSDVLGRPQTELIRMLASTPGYAPTAA